MRRREFITLVGSAAGWPAIARAQKTDRVRAIGVLATFAETDPNLVTFKNRLQELGWTEAKLRIATRVAEDGERVRTSAAELVTLAPDAILSTTSTTARALLDATSTIPIVSAVTGDPIALGFTRSMSRPTGNITGFTTFNDTVASKRLEMLREMMGSMDKTALMWVPVNPQQVLLAKQTEEAAKDLGIGLLSLPLDSADDIAPALAKAESAHVQAIVVAADPLTVANARAIIVRPGHLAGLQDRVYRWALSRSSWVTPTARAGRPGGREPPAYLLFSLHRALFARASNHGAASGEPRSLVN